MTFGLMTMVGGTVAAGAGAAILAVLLGVLASRSGCGSTANLSGPVALGPQDTLVSTPPASQDPVACAPGSPTGVPLTEGDRAKLLPNGLAAAPADAPAAVKGMIAAGNQIAGKPYLYGGAHGLALSEVASSYDCSSSVEHLLYGGGL